MEIVPVSTGRMVPTRDLFTTLQHRNTSSESNHPTDHRPGAQLPCSSNLSRQFTSSRVTSYPTPKIVWPIYRVTISGRMVLLPHARGFEDFNNHAKTISESAGPVTSRITRVEQTVNALVVKMALSPDMEQNVSAICRIETNAASASSGAVSSHGPGSFDDSKNTMRRLDTFSSPEDEHGRIAVQLHFQRQQFHAGVSIWLEKFWATTNQPFSHKPTKIHCKAGSVSVRLVFETRAKCQDVVALYKDDGTLRS